MARIVFKGQEYNSVDEMPLNVRMEYDKAQGTPSDPKLESSELYSNLDQIPPDVRPIYDRVMGRIDDDKKKSGSSISDLPSVKDMMGRADPSEQEQSRSDETLFKPSPPLSSEQFDPSEKKSASAQVLISAILFVVILGIVTFLLAR